MKKKIRNHVQQKLSQFGGNIILGESASYNWIDDPSRLLFSLSRYKFVAKVFDGFESVLEVGSADGLGAYLVSRRVKDIICVDIDSELIESARSSVSRYARNISFFHGDITDNSFLKGRIFNGIFLLDVLEHISIDDEDNFLNNLCIRLAPFGSLVIGMPSLESQKYASKLSKIGHINCKTHDQLQKLCQKHFNVCYMFGANDEIIHTGYSAMQHYRLALCSDPKLTYTRAAT
jgi:2-polyprenyl-3-methyl-5-hydroxy-6-metoxy-1,4-benzoquinol methylase